MILHKKFIETAKRKKDVIAVYDEATKKEFTYEKMLIAALFLFPKFKKFNSEYVGIMIPTSLGAMLSTISTLMAGKIPVMINFSTGAVQNAKYAQEKCSFKTIITSKKLLEKLQMDPIDGMIFIEDIIKKITVLDKLKAAILSKMPVNFIQNSVANVKEDDAAVILFTSGSEKDPKAVELSHKNISHNLINIPLHLKITEDDLFMANLPLFHVFGLTIVFWLPITLGSSVITYPNPLDFKIISKLVKKYKANVIAGTPSFFYGFIKKSDDGDFSSMRLAVSGADKLPIHIYESFLEKHGVKILEGYGTTETSPVISVNTPTYHKVGSIGKPMPNTKVKIIDHETGEELPLNTEGKIIVKGNMVMNGYLGDLEETSLRVRNGWYDTGDMGLMDEDGYLWHKGRLKRFVKIGGEMVSLVRVESVLEKYLPDDAVCCVVDVPNPTKGADIVVAITTEAINKKKIIRQMAKELPSIALPKDFYIFEELPIMPSGKINFREVTKICREMQEVKKKKKK